MRVAGHSIWKASHSILSTRKVTEEVGFLKYVGQGQSEEHVVKKKSKGMTWNWVGTVKRMVQRERKVTGKCDSWVCCVLSHYSHVWLFATLWIVAHQAPLSVRFSRQEYWSGLPFPAPGDLPHPGIEPASLTSPALAGKFLTTSATWEPLPNMCQLEIGDKETSWEQGKQGASHGEWMARRRLGCPPPMEFMLP